MEGAGPRARLFHLRVAQVKFAAPRFASPGTPPGSKQAHGRHSNTVHATGNKCSGLTRPERARK